MVFMMLNVSLVADGVTNNSIFDLAHPSNRDNCNLPFHMLRKELSLNGIVLSTSDVISYHDTQLKIHINSKHDVAYSSEDVIILFETPNICPSNNDVDRISKAALVFSWDDDLVARYANFKKLNFPNVIINQTFHSFSERDIPYSMISGNKFISFENDALDLYKERIKIIKWFEKNHPEKFYLYGTGWNNPPAAKGIYNKISKRIYSSFLHPYFGVTPFPSYNGIVKFKKDIYRRTRFAFCFENVAGYNGYITEKIFDCFFSGCVPIYWGASNISHYIPDGCYIDMRNFSDYEQLYKYLSDISESEYSEYQQRIYNYISSREIYQFSAECFVETVAGSLLVLLDRT